jgi:hypothetical protein
MEDKKKFNLSGFIRACQDAYPDKRMFLAYISKRWDDVAEERLSVVYLETRKSDSDRPFEGQGQSWLSEVGWSRTFLFLTEGEGHA